MLHRFLNNLFRPLLFLLVAGAVGQVRAQSFEIKSPLVVSQGEQFLVELVATSKDGKVEGFKPPVFSGGLTVIVGPTVSTGWSFSSSSTGGQQSQSTNTFSYLLQASTLGKQTISSASITIDGRGYSSKAIAIECVSGGAAGGRRPGTQQGGSNGQAQSALAADDLMLRMEVNKTSVYRGEPVVASMKIYTRVGIEGFESPKFPALNGFFAQEIDVSHQDPIREVVGGKEYTSKVLRQWVLYPQRAGTLEVEQAEYTALAQVVSRNQSGNNDFDLFFGGGAQVRTVSRRLSTTPVRVQVKELPQPAPAGFTGAVGQFKIEALSSGDRFSANSAGSITLRLSGTGNFALIEAPKITLPIAFEQYDTKKQEHLTLTPNGASGQRVYEYPFIARAEGTYNLPPVEFSYFDPSTGRYNTLITQRFDFEILHDDNPGGTGSVSMLSGVTKEDLKLLGQDIRYIRSGSPGLHPRGNLFLWSWGWWALLLVLLGAFAAALRLLQRRIRERADLTKQKTKKANRVALKRLKKAKGHMHAGSESAFFEELLRALWGYVGDKLTIEVAHLNKERIRTELAGRGIADDECETLLTLISECEFAQYSPAAGIGMESAYTEALELIGRFESKL